MDQALVAARALSRAHRGHRYRAPLRAALGRRRAGDALSHAAGGRRAAVVMALRPRGRGAASRAPARPGEEALRGGASCGARRRRDHHRAVSHPARPRRHLPGARERLVRRRRRVERGRRPVWRRRRAAVGAAAPKEEQDEKAAAPPAPPAQAVAPLEKDHAGEPPRTAGRGAPRRLRRRLRLRASTTGNRTRRCTTRPRSCRRDRVCPAGRGRSSTSAGAGPSPPRSGSICTSSRPTRTSCSRSSARRFSSWCSSGWRRGRSVSFRAAGRRRRSLCCSRVRRRSPRVRRGPTCRTRRPSTSSRRD